MSQYPVEILYILTRLRYLCLCSKETHFNSPNLSVHSSPFHKLDAKLSSHRFDHIDDLNQIRISILSFTLIVCVLLKFKS